MKGSLRIAAGIPGAVAGFIATLLMFELVGLGNRADPITSGLVALFVLRPRRCCRPASCLLPSW